MEFFYRFWLTAASLCLVSALSLLADAKDRDAFSPGFVVEFSATADEVLQVLNEVLHDQTIHGTYMFDKEPTLMGARVVESTALFEPWREDGKVFYKIRENAIAPRHFRDSADQGTIAVRYVVTRLNEGRVRLRIDAIFVETARRVRHPSDGSVESSEYKVIKERLQSMQLEAQEAAEAQRRRESVDLAKQSLLRQREDERARLAAAESSTKELEQRLNALRHELVERVKAPGASLKAAPFRSAASMAELPAYSEVVIVIVTPRWYGIETSDGRRGWLPVDQLELLP